MQPNGTRMLTWGIAGLRKRGLSPVSLPISLSVSFWECVRATNNSERGMERMRLAIATQIDRTNKRMDHQICASDEIEIN